MPPDGSQSNSKDGGKGVSSGWFDRDNGKRAPQKETDKEFTLAIDEMKLTDLKDELRKRDISATGNKSSLKERLRKAEDAANDKENNTTDDEDELDSDSTDDAECTTEDVDCKI